MSAGEPDTPIAQFNLGERSRIAGRDYYESRVPDSIKVYLATTPSDRLDAEAIDNERLFSYRFGLDVPRPAREQVIALKRQHGLTDAECRWLRRSGQFRITREGAKLVPDRLVPAAAWFYAVVLAFFFGSSLLVINLSSARRSTLVRLHVGRQQALLGALEMGEGLTALTSRAPSHHFFSLLRKWHRKGAQV